MRSDLFIGTFSLALAGGRIGYDSEKLREHSSH